jgi:hypothetical protein
LAAASDVTTAGVPSTAGGIAFADVDDDGALEAIVHYSWDGGGVAAGSYRVGDQLDRAGRPAGWLGPYNTGSSSPGTPAGGGIAYANVGRSPRADWTSMRGRINLLLRLRELWRTAAARVPRVGVGDPDQTLLDLLASDAGSAAVAVRPVIGPLVAESLWFAVNDPLAATYRSDLEARLAPAAALAGLTGTPRLGSLACAPDVLDDAAPLGADQPTSYLAEMAIATPRQLHDKWIGPGIPLLARLIRHGLLQAYADAALRLVPVDLVEPELVDLADVTAQDPATPGHTLTSWRHLAEATLNGVPVADLLHKAAHSSRPGPEAAPVAEAVAAVRRLAALPADALHRLMMETLDLSTHRLDAWMTAVATQRMRELRHRQPTGIQLGGYGIVTDLRPATGAASTGYVHAPSIGHAATAAVLRSGYLSHGSEALAVDLSSTRARLALDLLDGIRSGQSLGALLGYRFERELADRGVSQYLPALRQLAPEVVGQLTAPPAGTAVEAVSALATVDGLALLTRWRDQAIPWGGSVPGQPGNLPATGTADQVALIAALTVLRDTVDAVADVGVAESVHQALQGNHLRAGGSLDALSRGELPPPEPDVLRSPRTGVALTHRLVVIADDPDAAPALSAWKATAAQQALWQRATAEPRLNAWAATVLGDPGRVRWRASFVDAATGAPSAQPERTFTLAEVGLCPLDVLYGPSPAVAALGETDLGRRLCAHAAAATAAVVPPVAPMLVSERDAAWSPQLLALGELLTVAELARDLVGGARAADARDLAPAGLTTVPGMLGDDLDRRAAAAIAGFADARSALRAPFQLQAGEPAVLRAALAAPDIPDDATSLLALPAHVDIAAACRALQRPSVTALAEVRAPLTRLSAFGIPGAAPRNVAGSDDAARGALAIQARDIAQAAAARAARAAAATDATGRLHAILGDDFCVLPLFAPAHPGDLTEALAVRDKAGDALTAAVEDWFEGAARVRIGAHRLCDVRLIAPVVGGEAAALVALQLPPRRGDRWVGTALPPDATMTGGITGIAIASHQPWRPDAAQAGLVVDEWVEVVPNRAETTGLVFHYDAPGACAPQALLLAVSPDPSRPWDLATLAAILLETIDATRIRAVRPHDVRQLGHVVPALLFARNAGGDPAGDTISTTFER